MIGGAAEPDQPRRGRQPDPQQRLPRHVRGPAGRVARRGPGADHPRLRRACGARPSPTFPDRADPPRSRDRRWRRLRRRRAASARPPPCPATVRTRPPPPTASRSSTRSRSSASTPKRDKHGRLTRWRKKHWTTCEPVADEKAICEEARRAGARGRHPGLRPDPLPRLRRPGIADRRAVQLRRGSPRPGRAEDRRPAARSFGYGTLRPGAGAGADAAADHGQLEALLQHRRRHRQPRGARA